MCNIFKYPGYGDNCEGCEKGIGKAGNNIGRVQN